MHIHRTIVILGAFLFVIASPREAGGAAANATKVDEAKRAWPESIRLALGCEDAKFWRGGAFVTSPKKSGRGAIRWDHHKRKCNSDGGDTFAHPAADAIRRIRRLHPDAKPKG